MRLIDADALLKSVCEVEPDNYSYIKAVRDIVNAPAIKAVKVNVERCLFCKYWTMHDEGHGYTGDCDMNPGEWTADDFCSRGEQLEEKEDESCD